MNKIILGIDVGSVTTKCAVLNERLELSAWRYFLTSGKPIEQIKKVLKEVEDTVPEDTVISAVGTTGSARYLAAEIVGADVIKNEITAHAAATLHLFPGAQTIIEIGGQDSKIIIIRDGVIVDFGMNTVCAAGTGSFLDHQALRLGIDIENLSTEALKSTHSVLIAGRCTVFAESDMIHKQQMGHNIRDILYGLCQALVRNYINNVGLGKELRSPIIFQGGVAYNKAIIRAFEEELNTEVMVPPHHEVMGAIGVALLAAEKRSDPHFTPKFKGFEVTGRNFETSTFNCKGCPNQCEIAQLASEGRILAKWGGRCERWESNVEAQANRETKILQSVNL
ncbi:MAG: 2-hydroxyglutaryl-CoA dehydratase [Chloroflexi bacterium RBG_16_48_7]|nr:MAG: 2-hydroxyglutaryl-CoA dehydratase [Chloroflexi bacterium RBG_16_48_7]